MKLFASLPISSDTLARLAVAAGEHQTNVSSFASIAVMAAARLWLSNRRTTAMPATVPAVADATIALTLSDETIQILADAASENGLTLKRQIHAALAAAVIQPVPAKPAIRKPVPDAVPRRRPFDPKYYARHAVAFREERPR